MLASTLSQPAPGNNYHQEHVLIILGNLQRWTGKNLIREYGFSLDKLGERVFNADFYLLSHTNASDPILNYANRKALELWEVTWEELITMPSSKTAKPVDRQERSAMLDRVSADNYFDGYRGIRISKTGKEFYISDGIIWNLLINNDELYGQAAWFKSIELINPIC